VQQVPDIEEYNKMSIKYANESLDRIIEDIGEKIILLIFTGGIRKSGAEHQWIEHSHENDLDWVMQFKSENESKYNIDYYVYFS
jgi:hypothetical protein